MAGFGADSAGYHGVTSVAAFDSRGNSSLALFRNTQDSIDPVSWFRAVQVSESQDLIVQSRLISAFENALQHRNPVAGFECLKM